MNRWFRARVIVGCTSIWIGVAGFVPAIGEMARQTGEQKVVESTVSVASLRIPHKAWMHLDKARQYSENLHEDKYVRETEKALEIAPDFAEVYLLRAAHELVYHRYDTTIDNVLAAQRIEPEIKWAGVILAGAYNGLRRHSDAALILRNLHGPESDSWQAKFELARSQVGMGDVEGALQTTEVVLKIAPPACVDAYLLRADALELAHRWREADDQLAMYLSTQLPQAHREEALLMQEKTRKAAEREELASNLALR